MPETYEVIVCPVCRQQLFWSYDEGARCYHDDYGEVEGVEVEAELPGLDAAAALGVFKLTDQKRERAFQKAERAWFRNLPKEEQERLEAERRAKMSPFARTLEDLMRSAYRDIAKDLSRDSFAWSNADAPAS